MTKHTKHLKMARLLHIIVIPVLLVGSDLLIGAFGHYSGSTGAFSIESIIDYIMHPNWLEWGIVLVFAVAIMITVEFVVKYRIKHHEATN